VTARILLSCDTVHPDRVPNTCRAYLPTTTVHVDAAYEEAEAAGWTQTPDGDGRCPSCSRAAT
jgi:hypothetical protein